MPIVLSGKYAAFIDPHRTTVLPRETFPAGVRKKLSEVLSYTGHASTFHEIFEVDKTKSYYNGTLFRFPLRKPGNKSDILTDCVTVDKIKSSYFKSFEKEASYILLFLKNVLKISLYERNHCGELKPLLSVEMKCSHMRAILNEREIFSKSEPECLIQLYGATVCSQQFGGRISFDSNHWLILTVFGTTDLGLFEKGKDLSTFPCIGLALPVPVLIDHTFKYHGPASNLTDAANELLLSDPTLSVPKYLPLSVSSPLNFGKAFCFLPLPVSTWLPIHVNGSFAVGSSRKSIVWNENEFISDESNWNKDIVKKMVAPAYALLLLVFCKLFRFEDPLQNMEMDTLRSAFTIWPVYNEIKNEYIWKSLLNPVLSTLENKSILWSNVDEGKWVSFQEAYFAFDDCPKIVTQALLHAGIAVVLLPPEICETLHSMEHFSKLIQERSVQPHHLRKHYPQDFHCTREDKFKLLNFLLSGLSDASEMNHIPLLPLLDQSWCSFDCTNAKYHISNELKKQYEGLSLENETGNMVVDYKIPSDIYQLLISIFNTQIKEVDLKSFFQVFIKQSISKWAGELGPKLDYIYWHPDNGIHPSKIWLNNLWSFVCKKKCFEAITHLPIIPVRDTSDSFKLFSVKETSSRFCYVARSASSVDMISVLTKLNFVIVDEGLTHECSLFQYITVPKLLNTLPVDAVMLIDQMKDVEKDVLLRFIVDNCKQLNKKHFFRTICGLPLFKISMGLSPNNYLPICDSKNPSRKPFFRPAGMGVSPTLLPPLVLIYFDISITNFLRDMMGVESLKFSKFCIDHWIPFALSCLQTLEHRTGDTIFIKILEFMRKKEDEQIISCLKQSKFVCSNDGNYFTPSSLYDASKKLEILVDNFNLKAPGKLYYPFTSELRCLGLKNWTSVCKNEDELYRILKSSVSNAELKDYQLVLKRAKILLEMLGDSRSVLSKRHKADLVGVPCIAAAPRPALYPSSLEWYCTQDKHKYFSIRSILPWKDNVKYLVGSVVPIANEKYSKSEGISNFKVLEVKDVIHQLRFIESKQFKSDDVSEINPMVTSIYGYLKSKNFKFEKLWAPFIDPPKFVAVKNFVLTLPFDMQPFFYKLPMEYKHLAMLLEIKHSIDEEICQSILKELSQGKKEIVREKEKLIIDIIMWVYNNKKNVNNMLMLSSDGTLEVPTSMYYDDRNWSLDASSHSHGRVAPAKVVHPNISSSVAKYFKVSPLSVIIAPSTDLRFHYEKAGQKETLTNRISKIVQDYSSDIDVFKELIQNADDAEAEVVKFCIDWTQYGNKSLFTKEMGEWQGPALLAYNDALFSDDDLKDICRIAGQSKKMDCTKIGQFGLGFCATYHLTDVPSFVTGKYLVIFDPHTCYLRDRITPSNPGMKIDLVATQSDLRYYEDQLAPYEGIFDCNVTSLQNEGYSGTLFRFPFRNSKTRDKSEICPKIYGSRDVQILINSLITSSEEIIIFLKHVKEITFFERQNSSSLKEIYSISRRLENAKRVDILSNKTTEKSSSTKCCITSTRGDSKVSSSQWLICSHKGDSNKGASEGLVPFCEIAMKLKKKEHCIHQDKTCGKVFSFLPLPIRSRFDFHLNGCFVVSKDRRHIPLGNEASGKWNSYLCSDVVNQVYLDILKNIVAGADMAAMSIDQRKCFLDSYYKLLSFKFTALTERLSMIVKKSIYDSLPVTDIPLLWSEVHNGSWFSPKNVCVFRDDKSIPNHILQDIFQTIILDGLHFVDIPGHIYSIIKNEECKVLNYRTFIEEVLFPKIIEHGYRKSWVLHLSYILNRFDLYYADSNKWIADILQSQACIPCQSSDELRNVKDVVDCTNEFAASLFDVSEGRFPVKDLLAYKAKIALIHLGMSSSKLSVEIVVDRAQSVLSMKSSKEAMTRSRKIILYIEKLRDDDEKLNNIKEKVSEIQFIPTCNKPDGVELPWFFCPDSPYSSPSELYSSKQKELVFSVAKIAGVKSILIPNKSPDAIEVVKHLKLLVQATAQLSCIEQKTADYLDRIIPAIYSYFEGQLCQPQSRCNLTEALKSIDKPIWQKGMFRSPQQVVACSGSVTCLPYLLQLSEKYWHEYQTLFFEVFGVKKELSLQSMISLLQCLNKDHFPTSPLSAELVKFSTYLASNIADSLEEDEIEKFSSELFLPDNKGVMRKVSCLACDDHKSDFIKNSQMYHSHFADEGHFVHSDIPRKKVIKLGVYPILDAIMKECEDDDFLSGQDYHQTEDLRVRLNSILSKYPVNVSILQEFLQNAEDAQASEVIFVLDHRTSHPSDCLFSDNERWKMLQDTPALCIVNNRKLEEPDIVGISKLGEGGKQQSTKSIGKFGIGFNVAYHVTDCPSFLSYNTDGSPENLCAFDPTCRYIGRKKPGRRWNLHNRDVGEFKDQYSPYLFQDICDGKIELNDKESGYVVFRLPLTKTGTKKMLWHLNDKQFTVSDLQQLLSEYGQSSKEILLFLNNVKTVSGIEITRDGKFEEKFKVSSRIPRQFQQKCIQFVKQCEDYKQAISNKKSQEVSTFYQLKITYDCLGHSETKSWLIQKILFGKFGQETLELALQKNIRAVGAVAAPMDYDSDFTGNLFFYLPLPIKSSVPLHVHGHFITDDSRKHLEDYRIGDHNWNYGIVECIVTPAYIQFILNVKRFMLSQTEDKEIVSKAIYRLFPSQEIWYKPRDPKSQNSLQSYISRFLYKELVNCQEPLFLIKDKAPYWYLLKEVFFCDLICEKGLTHSITKMMCIALTKLGMKIISSAPHIPRYLSHYSFPNRLLYQNEVIEFLSRVDIRNIQNAEILKKELCDFLKFCLDGYKPKEVPNLLNRIPLIVTMDQKLQRRSQVFSKKYSKLLLKSSNTILEEFYYTSVQHKLQSVIQIPNLSVISGEIPLPITEKPVLLKDDDKNLVVILWKCLIEDRQYQNDANTKLVNYFKKKPILPASGGYFYPMCLSKTLFKISDQRISEVLEKLNYRKLDMESISINNEQVLLNLKECVFSKNEDIIACFQQQNPVDVVLSETEIQVIFQMLQSCAAEKLQSIS